MGALYRGIFGYCSAKMLSLQQKDGAVLVCHIQRAHEKPRPVWYYFDVDDSMLHEIDDYDALLKTSLPKIKTKLRINQETVNAAVKLIQSKKEPAEGEKAPRPAGILRVAEAGERIASRRNRPPGCA